MCNLKDDVTLFILLTVAIFNVVSLEWSEEDKEDLVKELMENGLTLVEVKQNGSMPFPVETDSLKPMPHASEEESQSDHWFASDYGLGRYRRQAQNEEGSGEECKVPDCQLECDPPDYECRCTEPKVNHSNTCIEIVNVTFGFTIDIDVSNLGNDNDLKEAVRAELFAIINRTVSNLVNITILSLRNGSLIVEAEAVLEMLEDEDTVAPLARAVINLAGENFTVLNLTGKVSNITVNDTVVSDVCDFYQKAIGSCPENGQCQVDSEGLPFCRRLKDDTDLKLIIGLAVGIPLFLTAVIIITVMVYVHRRKRKRHSDEVVYHRRSELSDMMLGRGIATRGGVWNPARSLYRPENLSKSASSDEGLRSSYRSGTENNSFYRANLSRFSLDYDQGAQSFSWDFLFNQMPPGGETFSIKRPKMELSGNKLYATAREDSMSYQSTSFFS